MFQTRKYHLNYKCSVTVKQSAYLMFLKDDDGVFLKKSETRELPRPTHLRVTAARLAQLGEDRSAKQEDTNLNLGGANNQDFLKTRKIMLAVV